MQTANVVFMSDRGGELVPRASSVTREREINVVAVPQENCISSQSDFTFQSIVSPGNINHEYPQNAIWDSASSLQNDYTKQVQNAIWDSASNLRNDYAERNQNATWDSASSVLNAYAEQDQNATWDSAASLLDDYTEQDQSAIWDSASDLLNVNAERDSDYQRNRLAPKYLNFKAGSGDASLSVPPPLSTVFNRVRTGRPKREDACCSSLPS